MCYREDLSYLYFGISTDELNYCIENDIDPDDYYNDHYCNLEGEPLTKIDIPLLEIPF